MSLNFQFEVTVCVCVFLSHSDWNTSLAHYLGITCNNNNDNNDNNNNNNNNNPRYILSVKRSIVWVSCCDAATNRILNFRYLWKTNHLPILTSIDFFTVFDAILTV